MREFKSQGHNHPHNTFLTSLRTRNATPDDAYIGGAAVCTPGLPFGISALHAAVRPVHGDTKNDTAHACS